YMGKKEEVYNDKTPQEQFVSKVKTKYQISGDYFLFIGQLEPRKNLVRAVEAFAKVSQTNDISFVIAGKKGWGYDPILNSVKQLNLEKRVLFLGYISEEESALLMKECTAFIYPTLYEGFGIPVLEAMTCGSPVITSNISSIPEVGGDAVISINPEKTEELTKAMQMVLEWDNVKREDYKKRATQQSAKFSWTNSAEETLKTYLSFFPDKSIVK
ncbi:MAG: glycosyltransferase family 4 protein, partial [Nitrospinae bacterium]|nr:glycosyltransferase family 4 protein [Nitrospinota bacterium]